MQNFRSKQRITRNIRAFKKCILSLFLRVEFRLATESFFIALMKHKCCDLLKTIHDISNTD